MSTNTPNPIARLLGASAAGLLLVGLLTGLLAGAAMTDKIHVEPRAALAAHLNALMGTFLIVSYAWSLPLLRYSEVGKKRIAMIFIASSFANWAITTLKACLFVGGLEASGSGANLLVFTLLQVGVVLPSLVAAAAWLNGFRRV